MVDYTVSKERSTGSYPVEVKETSGLTSRIESILTPEMLVSRYLKGVDLKDFSDEELQDQINLATNEVELLSNLTVTKVQYKEVLPFDLALYQKFVHTKVSKGPILSVESFAIESSNEKTIYPIPVEWLDLRLGHRRQINVVPLLLTATTSSAGSAMGALLFAGGMGGTRWLPSYWRITYTVGLCREDGKLPIVINDIIGLTAAMEILSIKQNTFKGTSQSLSQDGISQSSSSHGPTSFQNRIEIMEKKRDKLLSKVKAIFFQKYYVGSF